MSDISFSGVYVQRAPAEPQSPPYYATGPVAWVRANLFASVFSSILTISAVAFLAWITPPLLRYLFTDAVWSAPNGEACRVPGTGACWAFISFWLPNNFTFGLYPPDQRWRVTAWFAMAFVLVGWLLSPKAPRQGLALVLFFTFFPVATFVLLHGLPLLGLPVVGTHLWGGIFVSLLVSLVGIVFSLPLGILLALGRQSSLPIVKMAATIFIEFVRGVPFITVLFMAVHMLPLFVPDGYRPDTFLLPLIGTALFAAAYMAEVVRSGLQAMPKGQTEGAQALGLGYWQTMRLIILPQALTITIPNIVSNFIGLFKDTTLVANVGIFDFLKTVEVARNDANWSGPTVSTTGYVFAAMFYFVFCFGMAQYSRYMERKLARAKKR